MKDPQWMDSDEETETIDPIDKRIERMWADE